MQQEFKTPKINGIKGIIFDLDGTLLYTLPSLHHAGNLTLAHYGYDPLPLENYRHYVGDGALVLLERIFAAAKARRQEAEPYVAPKDSFQVYEAVFETAYRYQVEPYDGVYKTLEFLKNKGLELYCLSNKQDKQAKALIQEHFGDHLFKAVKGFIPGGAKKPDPKVIFEWLSVLKKEPSELILLGDSDADMLTAKRAGLLACGAVWGYRGAEELAASGADYLLNDILELQSLVN